MFLLFLPMSMGRPTFEKPVAKKWTRIWPGRDCPKPSHCFCNVRFVFSVSCVLQYVYHGLGLLCSVFWGLCVPRFGLYVYHVFGCMCTAHFGLLRGTNFGEMVVQILLKPWYKFCRNRGTNSGHLLPESYSKGRPERGTKLSKALVQKYQNPLYKNLKIGGTNLEVLHEHKLGLCTSISVACGRA